MKKLNKLLIIFLCLSVGMMISCSQEQNTDFNEETQKESPFDSNFERAIIDKVGDDKAQEILDQILNQTRAPIAYNGELCPGVVNSGVAPVRNGFLSGFAAGDFWYFSALAGDVITIDVDRVNCEMDPIMLLYYGFGDDTSLVEVAASDDEDLPCEPACFAWYDPLLIDFALPSTGVYTVVVFDFFSGACVSGPLAYDIVVTGQNPCIIVIDGCDTGVANQILPDGTTMQQGIDACAAAATNHGDFVSCVARLTNAWVEAGLITGEEKGRIQSCAAGANIP